MRLEIGSGMEPTPGFTHLDLNPDLPQVDIVGPAFPLELLDASVDEIRAANIVEHVSYRDTDRMLVDWHRVMRPGGRLFIQVPDAETIMRWFVYDPDRLVDRLPAELPRTPLAGAAWRLLGGHADGGEYVGADDDWRWNAHYALFSETSIIDHLTRAGFTVDSVEVNIHPNLLVWATRP